VYPNGRSVYYSYSDDPIGDRLNRVRDIADYYDAQRNKFEGYTYLGSGTVVKISHGNANYLSYGTGGTYDGFDQFGRIVDQKWTSGTVRDQYTYGYDYASNRLWRKNEQKAEFSELYHANGSANGYDGLNRFTEFRRGTLNTNNDTIDDEDTTRRQICTLDQLGNWGTFQNDAGDGSTWDLDQTRTHNSVNEIDVDDNHANDPGTSITATTGGNWTDPAYDANGNMTLAPRPGDESTEDEGLLFTYDAWNRPVKVYKDDGNTRAVYDVGDALVAEYQYDGLNRRIVKLLPNGADDWDRTDYYYNTSWQVIEECYVADQDERTPVATGVKCQYIWSLRYVDTPILRDRDAAGGGHLGKTDSGLDERLYYTTDANMNVTALVEGTPGDGDLGKVVERYIYDPYGKVTVLDGETDSQTDWATDANGESDVDNEILYCGYRYDPETVLYHVRNRYYHPTLGRWITRDPKDGNKPGGGYHDGMNLYEYVRSGPLTHADPSGLGDFWTRKGPSGKTMKYTFSTKKCDACHGVQIDMIGQAVRRMLQNMDKALDDVGKEYRKKTTDAPDGKVWSRLVKWRLIRSSFSSLRRPFLALDRLSASVYANQTEFACDNYRTHEPCKKGASAYAEYNTFSSDRIVFCEGFLRAVDEWDRIVILIHEMTHLHISAVDTIGTGIGYDYSKEEIVINKNKFYVEYGPLHDKPEYREIVKGKADTIHKGDIPGFRRGHGGFSYHADTLAYFIMEWNYKGQQAF